MKRRVHVKRCAGIVMAAVMPLSGCGTVPQSVQLVNSETHVITVTAAEEVRVEPDMAEVVYGVTTEAADAETCRQQNSEAVAAVVEALKALGVEESSIQTTRLNLSPQYDWSQNYQKLVGYEMSATLTVSDLPIDLVGKLLEDSVSAGVNQVQSVTYQSSRYDESYQQALELAVQNARTKAEAIAKAGSCTISGIANVQEYLADQSGRYTNAKALLADAAEMSMSSVQPGELRVAAQVRVDFVIQ